jgi:hypothetical protein
LADDAGNDPQRNESEMLTPTDIDTLNSLARDLAQRRFGGAGSVGRNTDGIVRLTIMKLDRGAGGLYRVRETLSPTFEAASREVAKSIESAANP